MKKIKVSIIGAAGLSSGILMKHLLKHKNVELSILVSESQAGKSILELHPEPELKPFLIDKKVVKYVPNDIVENSDLVFLCKHHKEAMMKTAELIDLAKGKNKNIKFIDLSADFRLKDSSLYEKWYCSPHSQPELLKAAVYGLPELYSEKIKTASIVANPGCYPTSAILGIAPILKNLLLKDASFIIDACSGFSGAGKSKYPDGFGEENITAYKVCSHPHIPEIEQELELLANKPIHITFVPHVASFKYGLFTTSYLKLNRNISWEELINMYDGFYKNKPFIRLMKKEKQFPEIPKVAKTNFCDIGIQIDERTGTCIVMSAIDNVMKGCSGQAIQNMNIMFGFNEVEGLPS